MIDKPEVHYWASGMSPEQAQLYLNDLCGSQSQSFTENPKEVTCERCLAALRAGRGAPGARVEEAAPSAAAEAAALAVVPNGVLERELRAAVLKEREEIVEYVQALVTLEGLSPMARSLLRGVIREIRKRA